MDTDDGRLRQILQGQGQGLNAYIDSHKQAIFDLISTIKCHVSIDRYIWGGSLGKWTSLGPGYKPDFDINLFFNLNYGYFDELQYLLNNNMEQIVGLLRNNYYTHVYRVLYKTQFAVGVLILHTGARVDLIPAVNFSKNRAVQYETVMSSIINEGFNIPWVTPSYAEMSVWFLKSQPPFVREVVRLAKYWNKTCVTMSGLTGRSVIVETVAIYAAQEEMESDDGCWSLTRALGKFLNHMADDWWNLRIIVYTDPVKFPSRAMDQLYDMQNSNGVLLDPVNPYRNFLEDTVAQNKWGIFQNAARSSLNKFNSRLPVERSIGFALNY